MEVVERLYAEMMEVVREAPVQIAGDTLLTLPGERGRRRKERPNDVFLGEEERVEEVEWVGGRLFYLISRWCMKLVWALVGSGMLLLEAGWGRAAWPGRGMDASTR